MPSKVPGGRAFPDKATWITRVASCEVVQDRTTQDGFPNTIEYVLLQPNEFGRYNAKAKIRACDSLANRVCYAIF